MKDAEVQGLERLLAGLMLAGVQLSAAALVLGLGLWLSGYARWEASWLLTGGLIALMATPMLRVAVSVVEAVRMRDWFFVAATSAVAALLTISVVYSLMMRR